MAFGFGPRPGGGCKPHFHAASRWRSVLVVGGRSHNLFGGAALFDYRTEQWATTGRMGVSRSGDSATLLPNGKVLVIGGERAGRCPGFHRTVHACDRDVGLSQEILNAARAFHTATLLPDGKVLVVGGLTTGGGTVELGTLQPRERLHRDVDTAFRLDG